MSSVRPLVIAVAALGFLTANAESQDNPTIPSDPQGASTRYDVYNMNFDMWCQEQQHLPVARCDKRLPEDDAAFNTYRAKIERYEIPYLRERQRQQQLNIGILHNDPVDRPSQPSEPQPPVTSPPPPK
jgi:hypothetical protein